VLFNLFVLKTDFKCAEEKPMRDRVEEALSRIRPTLQKDGGDVVLIDVTPEGVVKVQLTGACRDCNMSEMTLKNGIEKFLKSEVPEVTAVVPA